jgi:uncharacterized protein YdaU (DUF1376 family)
MNHYPFNPSDYMMATAHLEPMNDLCYRRCLDLYYDSEAPLMFCKRTLSKRLRVNEDVLSEVLAEFFVELETGYHHNRCDKEIARYQAKSEKAKAAGSIGGQRKQANAKRTLSKRLANASNQNQNQNQNQDIDADASPAKAPKPKRELKAQPIDDDYLAELQIKYPHAKVREQFANCTKWWLEKKKVHPSRRALVNWLDKVQPPPSASVATMDNGLGTKCRPL